MRHTRSCLILASLVLATSVAIPSVPCQADIQTLSNRKPDAELNTISNRKPDDVPEVRNNVRILVPEIQDQGEIRIVPGALPPSYVLLPDGAIRTPDQVTIYPDGHLSEEVTQLPDGYVYDEATGSLTTPEGVTLVPARDPDKANEPAHTPSAQEPEQHQTQVQVPVQTQDPEQHRTQVQVPVQTQDPEQGHGQETVVPKKDTVIVVPQTGTNRQETTPKQLWQMLPLTAMNREPVRPDTPKRPPAPKKGEHLSIPEQAAESHDLSFLKGCWVSVDDHDFGNGEAIEGEYCFNDRGFGQRRIFKKKEPGVYYTGPLRARMEGNSLIIDASEAHHMGCQDYYLKEITTCRGSGTKTQCHGVSYQNGKRRHEGNSTLIKR